VLQNKLREKEKDREAKNGDPPNQGLQRFLGHTRKHKKLRAWLFGSLGKKNGKATSFIPYMFCQKVPLLLRRCFEKDSVELLRESVKDLDGALGKGAFIKESQYSHRGIRESLSTTADGKKRISGGVASGNPWDASGLIRREFQ